MCLQKTLISSEPNRHYERVRIKPIGKWYYCLKHDTNIENPVFLKLET